MRTFLLAMLVAIAAAGPASAATSDCVAPPGTAAVDQYCETIPSATGDQGAGARTPQPLDGPAKRALRAEGKDGATLAGLLMADGRGTAGSPSGEFNPAKRAVDRGKSSRRPPRSDSRHIPGNDPLRAVTSAVESGPTLGGLFGWIVVATTALMAMAWLRARTRRA